MKHLILFFLFGYTTNLLAQTNFSSIEINGVNPISSTNGFYNLLQLKNPDHAAIVYQSGTTKELMFGFHSNGNFYWGAGLNAGNYYPMVLSKDGDLSLGRSLSVDGVSSIKHTLSVLSNGTNSSEVLLYKPDGGYTDIFSNNLGFGIYNSSLDSYVLNANNINEVGIGTKAVSGYRLAVAGNILTESIKVQPKSSWPDYVFSSSHNLTSLSDLEEYVVKNKHLPEIPTASEVTANGLDVGEINVKLLAKIEELTLYIIEQNKMLLEERRKGSDRDSRLLKQQKQIDKLKKAIGSDVQDRD